MAKPLFFRQDHDVEMVCTSFDAGRPAREALTAFGGTSWGFSGIGRTCGLSTFVDLVAYIRMVDKALTMLT